MKFNNPHEFLKFNYISQTQESCRKYCDTQHQKPFEPHLLLIQSAMRKCRDSAGLI